LLLFPWHFLGAFSRFDGDRAGERTAIRGL
jgi:hypothetical protein